MIDWMTVLIAVSIAVAIVTYLYVFSEILRDDGQFVFALIWPVTMMFLLIVALFAGIFEFFDKSS